MRLLPRRRYEAILGVGQHRGDRGGRKLVGKKAPEGWRTPGRFARMGDRQRVWSAGLQGG